jgi:hypothetical protein
MRAPGRSAEAHGIDVIWARLCLRAGRCLACGEELPTSDKATWLFAHWKEQLHSPEAAMLPEDSPEMMMRDPLAQSGDARGFAYGLRE